MTTQQPQPKHAGKSLAFEEGSFNNGREEFKQGMISSPSVPMEFAYPGSSVDFDAVNPASELDSALGSVEMTDNPMPTSIMNHRLSLPSSSSGESHVEKQELNRATADVEVHNTYSSFRMFREHFHRAAPPPGFRRKVSSQEMIKSMQRKARGIVHHPDFERLVLVRSCCFVLLFRNARFLTCSHLISCDAAQQASILVNSILAMQSGDSLTGPNLTGILDNLVFANIFLIEFLLKFIGLGPNAYFADVWNRLCLLYTSPSPRDRTRSRMPSSA